jgi:hypothetical protein
MGGYGDRSRVKWVDFVMVVFSYERVAESAFQACQLSTSCSFFQVIIVTGVPCVRRPVARFSLRGSVSIKAAIGIELRDRFDDFAD